MARRETDREDLLREATALARRIELTTKRQRDPIFAGFRRDGSLSLFFEPEFVVQFNSAREIRRGFSDGRLIKAEKGKLIALTRCRTDGQVTLVRHAFSDEETRLWLADVERRLSELAELLGSFQFEVRGQVPDDRVLDEVRDWLAVQSVLRVARSPRAR